MRPLLLAALVLCMAALACGSSVGAASAPGKSSCEQQCESQYMGCEQTCTQWNERVCLSSCDSRRATCLSRCN